MKRHSSLAPLSREHHAALILDQLLKKGAPVYKGLPVDLNGKADYAIRFYQNELIKHFEDEEKVVFKKILGINADLDKLAGELTEDHKDIRNSFLSIKNHPELEDHLDKLAHELGRHIRKEERQLFPLIQEVCSEDILEEIEKMLCI